MSEYRYLIDEHHLIEFADRSRLVKGGGVVRVILKSFCALGLSALLAASVFGSLEHPKLLFAAAIPGFFLSLLAAGPRFDYWIAKRRLRLSAFYGDTLTVTVQETGISYASPKSSAHMHWAALQTAQRLTDGFWLTSGPGMSYWWPDKALVAGSISEIERLLQAHVPRYAKVVA